MGMRGRIGERRRSRGDHIAYSVTDAWLGGVVHALPSKLQGPDDDVGDDHGHRPARDDRGDHGLLTLCDTGDDLEVASTTRFIPRGSRELAGAEPHSRKPWSTSAA